MSASTTFNLTLPEFLIAEVFDAIARLDCYLDEVELTVRPRSGIPLRLFRDTLHSVLYRSLEEPLRLTRQSTLKKTPLNPSEFQAVVNQLGSTFIGISGVHRFLKYLGVPEPPHEIFTLLKEIQRAFPEDEISANETDVLLSETLNYGEIDLHSAIESQLQQAKILTPVPGRETIVNDLTAYLEGRSTWGRLGLQVHSTASFVDPGFQGNLVFELQNVGKVPIELYAGLRVAQISFNRSSGSVQTYGGGRNQHYKGQLGPEGSRFYLDKDFERINQRLQELQQKAKSKP